jgi:hypothetical protein
MGDLIYLGITLAFFALTAWLAGFAERIMPAPVQRGKHEESPKELVR